MPILAEQLLSDADYFDEHAANLEARAKEFRDLAERCRKRKHSTDSSSAPQPKPSGWDRSNCPQRANGVCELATCECEESAHQQQPPGKT